MVQIFTAAVFLLVAAGTATLGILLDERRARAVERLAPEPRLVPKEVPSVALIWRELVSRLGAVLPASSKGMPLLKRRLVRAGIRHSGAPGLFQGARLVGAAVLTVAAVGLAARAGAETTNAVLGVGSAAAAGYVLPMQYLMWRIKRRQHAIEKGLPNALDLMVICVESGLGMDQTMLQVAKELMAAHPEISDEFTVMNLELRAGNRRTDALHNLAERTGVEDLKKLVAVLVQTDRFGTSIAQSLRGHADYLRQMARQRAEERASKLAVKLVFPIFFCVLPSLFAVTIGPVLTHLVRDLIPLVENM